MSCAEVFLPAPSSLPASMVTCTPQCLGVASRGHDPQTHAYLGLASLCGLTSSCH